MILKRFQKLHTHSLWSLGTPSATAAGRAPDGLRRTRTLRQRDIHNIYPRTMPRAGRRLPASPHHRCAVSNTVVGTVASASYAAGLATLADSAFAAGFACVVYAS